MSRCHFSVFIQNDCFVGGLQSSVKFRKFLLEQLWQYCIAVCHPSWSSFIIPPWTGSIVLPSQLTNYTLPRLCRGFMWNKISKLFQPSSTSVWNNFISAHRNMPEIISKLFHMLIAAHEYCPCWMWLK